MRVGLEPSDIGIRITFPYEEEHVWNLSEIYPEFPLMPEFRLPTEKEKKSFEGIDEKLTTEELKEFLEDQ